MYHGVSRIYIAKCTIKLKEVNVTRECRKCRFQVNLCSGTYKTGQLTRHTSMLAIIAQYAKF